MNIKGIQKTSLVDYPGKLSTVLFLGGCNFRCRYCHNPDLVRDSAEATSYFAADALELLKERSSLIDGVVVTGGEPTLSKDLAPFLQKIKEIPLPVKIDTNGSNPDAIERLLNKDILDYVAIDVKSSPEKYELISGVNINFNRIKETIELVKKNDIDYELRTTCTPFFVTLDDFIRIKDEIGHVKKYYLQQFVNKVTLDSSLQECDPYPATVLNEFREFVMTFADTCEIRGI